MTTTQLISNTFSLMPSGPFDLTAQSEYFGGWLTAPGPDSGVVMTFPIEGTDESAAVVVRQIRDGSIAGEVHGRDPADASRAWRQALAAISLDVDGAGWPNVGLRDPVLGRLQERYGCLRPTLFHSPYEAAAAFVIGHRRTIAQTRAIRARIAAEIGATIEIDGRQFHAFPTPARLLDAARVPGVDATRTVRLHAIARAAQEGLLARSRLRDIPREDALAGLQELPGVGPFFARGILHRGAGTIDAVVDDAVTRFAIAEAYRSGSPVSDEEIDEISAAWRPYRTWAAVLLHVWVRRERGLPPREQR